MLKQKLRHPLDAAFKLARPALLAVGFFSLCINLLMLTSPLYMLQVYDRVLVSRSVDTLVLLSIVALGALMLFGILEAVRSRVLVRVGARFDQGLADTVFASVMQSGAGAQPFRDLESIRTFLTGRSLTALFDAPWTPIYIALVFFLHPWLGYVALAGTVILLVIVQVNESATRRPLKDSAGEIALANRFVEAGSRNRDTIQAMGMLSGLSKAWHHWHDSGLALQAVASDRGCIVAGAAKFVRVFVQVAILGVGAYLAINEITTAGVMIAASIITGRALAPVEAAISGWRSFVQVREARLRLHDQLDQHLADQEPMQLPDPKGEIVFDNVYVSAPDSHRPILSAVSFRLEPGRSVGLIGPSAAGKSSLARLLVGVWQPSSGKVRLDGAELNQWSAASLGPGGVNLSGGQRQRIGMARAFYGRPPLIVLDEPTSNLDAVGEASVRAAIETLKTAGSTIVIIAHQPSLVDGVDMIMVVQKGTLTHFGPTAEVMPQISRQPMSAAQPMEASA